MADLPRVQNMGPYKEHKKNKYTLYWNDGDREVIEGKSYEQACYDAGYVEKRSMKGLVFWASGDDNSYVWDPHYRVWKEAK